MDHSYHETEIQCSPALQMFRLWNSVLAEIIKHYYKTHYRNLGQILKSPYTQKEK
jgi:hypothetical protein